MENVNLSVSVKHARILDRTKEHYLMMKWRK